MRDSNNYVIDEQTQCAPHLMPPPFLVDIDGNPYPPEYQRLVPGRENCNDSALVPYIAIHNANGVAEVLEPVIRPEMNEEPMVQGQGQGLRPTIDDMIQRLQEEQERELHSQRVNREHGYAALQERNDNEALSPGRARSRNNARENHIGMRRSGDIEGNVICVNF